MRKRIYEIISASSGNDKQSFDYDVFMIFVIAVSLVPLMFKQIFFLFEVTDKICAVIFIADYLLRWITADYKFQKEGILPFVRYPVSVMALIDLISILPSLTVLNQSFKLLRLLRMFRALRVFSAFKLFRHSKNIRIIMNVFQRQKNALSYVLILALGYIVISALIIFNVEPDSFPSFFDAVYWATISLTTLGYGDIYPVTEAGRLVTIVSSIFGVAIVALPAGIITAGYMEEIKNISDSDSDSEDIESENNCLKK